MANLGKGRVWDLLRTNRFRTTACCLMIFVTTTAIVGQSNVNVPGSKISSQVVDELGTNRQQQSQYEQNHINLQMQQPQEQCTEPHTQVDPEQPEHNSHSKEEQSRRHHLRVQQMLQQQLYYQQKSERKQQQQHPQGYILQEHTKQLHTLEQPQWENQQIQQHNTDNEELSEAEQSGADHLNTALRDRRESIKVYPQQNMVDYNPTNGNGFRLRPRPTHFIAAPLRVRPNQEVQIYVVIFQLNQPFMDVYAAIRKDGMSYAETTERFQSHSVRTIQLKMPDSAGPGNYTLRVHGSCNKYSLGQSGFLFENETKLIYHPKQFSVFVQTDKTIYKRSEWVLFRIIAVKRNLLPVRSTSITIYVKDPAGRTCRRWLQEQLYNGFYENKFYVGYPARYGTWTIEVEAKGHRFVKNVTVENWSGTRFDVNLTMPATVKESEFGLTGVVRANNTNGLSCKGNVTVMLQVIDPTVNDTTPSQFNQFSIWVTPPKESQHPNITMVVPYFNGVASFLFRMDDIRQMTRRLVGTKLRVYATFNDWETRDQKSNMATAVVIDAEAYIKFLGGSVRTFKPGQPLHVYISVVGYDGERLERFYDRQVLIETSVRQQSGAIVVHDEKHYLIPESSVVEFSYTPGERDELIKIRAALSSNTGNVIELSAYRHYTRQDHYIHVYSTTANPAINSYMVFTVRVSTFVEVVHYQIVSGGNIIIASPLMMEHQQKTFSIALSRDMIPYSSMIVFTLLPSGEVLSDCLNFHVDGLRLEELSVRTSNGNDITGGTFEVEFHHDPSVWVATSGTLLEMYKRGADNFFNIYKIEQELETYDDHVNNTFKQTWYKLYEQQENVYYSASTLAIDANTTFTFAGLIVFTDADLTRIPGAIECNQTQGYLPCYDGNCYMIQQHCDGVRQCEDGADEMGCPTEDLTVRPDPLSLDVLGRTHYHYDDATWLWKTAYTQPNGMIDITMSVPNRASLWVTSGFALGHDTGLRFQQTPMLYDTTQYSFMYMECPEQAYRGEQIGVQITVFNGINSFAEILLTLHGSDDYRFVITEDFGFVRSYDPRLTGGDIQTLVYLPPAGMRYIHFPVLPIKYGDIEITVEMWFGAAASVLSQTVKVLYDGVKNTYHTPYLIDLVNSGSMVIPDLKVNVSERFIDPGERRHLYVPGSATSTVSITGGVVGPGINIYEENLSTNNVINKAQGSAESYMFNIAIDIYWLRYLWLSNQIANNTLKDTLVTVNEDLTSLWAFMIEDGENAGAFKMFRRRSEPSIWLTAHALETLADSVETQWERLLYIDIKIINRVALWLTGQQNNVTGAFHETSIVYDRKMIDPRNLVDESGQSYNITLTAYVIIALAQSERVVTGTAAAAVKRSLQLGSNYIANLLDRLTDPFQLCIATYALTLARHRSRSDAFMKMVAAQRSDEYVYWAEVPIPKNTLTMIENIQTLMPRVDHPNEARAVQGTSYALMVYLLNNKYQEAIPIMKFIQTQRNFEGGFASTQDTLAAMQALAEFAHRDTNRAIYTIGVTVTATSSAGWENEVILPRKRFGEYHSLSIPKVFGSVRSVAEGVGYALMQVRTSVHVEYPHLLRQPVRPSFDIIADRLVFSGRNGSRFDMTVCARWLLTELSSRSGLAVIEIDIPTGYRVYRQIVLEEELKPDNADSWKRTTFENQKLYIHVDYIPSDWRCFSFYAVRWFPVANGTIQHLLKIYEYHEPGNYNISMYTTYDLFHYHICQVCGSFQCPYCPHYNRASTSLVNSLLISGFIFISFIATTYKTYFSTSLGSYTSTIRTKSSCMPKPTSSSRPTSYNIPTLWISKIRTLN